MYPQPKLKIFFRSNLLLKGKMIANNLEAAPTCDDFVQILGMWFSKNKHCKHINLLQNWQISLKQLKDLCLVPTVHPNNGRKTLQFLCFCIDKDLIQFMANREGRFKKIRPRSTPNSTAHKHDRCFQLKPHSLFARFHSRERLLGRRTAAMCSFVISNKISTSLYIALHRASNHFF